MTTVREGKLELRFPPTWTVSKYDDWSFYRAHFVRQCADNKAVDVVARAPSNQLWLVELKDYRVHRRSKSIELVEEVVVKVRDTLAGIFAAAKWQSEHANSAEAQACLRATTIRAVLHLEQPERSSKLFPRVYDLSRVQEKLKQRVRALDPHPRVVELASASGLPWETASDV